MSTIKSGVTTFLAAGAASSLTAGVAAVKTIQHQQIDQGGDSQVDTTADRRQEGLLKITEAGGFLGFRPASNDGNAGSVAPSSASTGQEDDLLKREATSGEQHSLPEVGGPDHDFHEEVPDADAFLQRINADTAKIQMEPPQHDTKMYREAGKAWARFLDDRKDSVCNEFRPHELSEQEQEEKRELASVLNEAKQAQQRFDTTKKQQEQGYFWSLLGWLDPGPVLEVAEKAFTGQGVCARSIDDNDQCKPFVGLLGALEDNYYLETADKKIVCNCANHDGMPVTDARAFCAETDSLWDTLINYLPSYPTYRFKVQAVIPTAEQLGRNCVAWLQKQVEVAPSTDTVMSDILTHLGAGAFKKTHDASGKREWKDLVQVPPRLDDTQHDPLLQAFREGVRWVIGGADALEVQKVVATALFLQNIDDESRNSGKWDPKHLALVCEEGAVVVSKDADEATQLDRDFKEAIAKTNAPDFISMADEEEAMAKAAAAATKIQRRVRAKKARQELAERKAQAQAKAEDAAATKIQSQARAYQRAEKAIADEYDVDWDTFQYEGESVGDERGKELPVPASSAAAGPHTEYFDLAFERPVGQPPARLPVRDVDAAQSQDVGQRSGAVQGASTGVDEDDSGTSSRGPGDADRTAVSASADTTAKVEYEKVQDGERTILVPLHPALAEGGSGLIPAGEDRAPKPVPSQVDKNKDVWDMDWTTFGSTNSDKSHD
ncbi:unnamed protein product [Amoebophrya sp. A120]|nr:unnamed protein product [Amoebophrya sp. A120]|eukprot:GSA120T00019903001.1